MYLDRQRQEEVDVVIASVADDNKEQDTWAAQARNLEEHMLLVHHVQLHTASVAGTHQMG